jgi:hypothetical protein
VTWVDIQGALDIKEMKKNNGVNTLTDNTNTNTSG